ncbi:hypothetical protein [Arcobacter sp.]|uniref:hypothetical protein n=1 Tax=unclassified Arcobacter TaxID=2593671 RepID=UPI003B0092BD|eukprot:TRINITY_DN890_c0_g2_i1.p2 TRINITY_DN890_c0_g2~~TRINITY_DN890_c0_g2_i1.p2  ORF type:complete len:252 (-),score=-27.96 TRINITY_DN890_c0_g2_i1:2115-2870(-)
MKKTVSITGLTKAQREEDLERIKKKLEKKGYVFIEYIDDGITKSNAIFEVDEIIVKKEFVKKAKIWGIVIIVIAIIVFFSSPSYDNQKETTLKDARTLPVNTLKTVASDYVKGKELSSEYNNKFYNCLGNLIYEKQDNYTIGKMLDWCYDDYKLSPNHKMKTYYNTALLLEGFSPWDGSYFPLETLIKNSMNDSSSYEHIKTIRSFVYYGVERPYMFVQTEFKGKNAFGGIVKQTIQVKVDAVTQQLFDLK